MRKVQVHAIRAEDRRQVGCIVLRILKELWCFIAAYQCQHVFADTRMRLIITGE
jgi:hypothetical protein